MNLEEELNLIEESKTNIQSFNKLYDIYFPKVFGYCINRMANREAAEDVTSQVFLKSIQVLKKFDTNRKTPLGPWLYAIAHNEMINYIKKNSKFLSSLEFEKESEHIQGDVEDDAIVNAERSITLSESQKQIAIILNKINPRYAEVITLKYIAQLETREIAQSLNIKPTQVPVLLFRALESFKKEFQKKFPKGEIFYIQ